MTNFYRPTNKPGQRDVTTKRSLPIPAREWDRSSEGAEAPAHAARGLSPAEIREIVRDLLG